MTLNRIYFAILALLAGMAFAPPLFIEAFDLKIYDLMTRYSTTNTPDHRVVVIGIDQKSLDAYGRWPWPRDILGKLVVKLEGFGVNVSAFDISFSTNADKGIADVVDQIGDAIREEGINEQFPDFYDKFTTVRKNLSKDESLATGIATAGNVVTGVLFHSGNRNASATETLAEQKHELLRPFRIKMVQRDAQSKDAEIWFRVGEVEPNIPMVQEAGAGSGFINAWTDPDGVIRSFPVFMESDGEVYPSLALAAVALSEGKLNDITAIYEYGMFQGAQIGDRFFPTDPHGRILIRYLGPDETFPIISAAEVLQRPLSDKTLRIKLKDKIALIGATATQIYDLRVTPFGITAGIEIHANVAANILQNRTMHKMDWQRIYDTFLTIVIGFATLLIIKRIRITIGAPFAISLLLGLIIFNYTIFINYDIWLNSVVPALTIIICFFTITISQYIKEQQSKKFIESAFGHYLSPEVISRIIEDPDQLSLGGEKRVMTAFFSDVAGFTTISEKLTAPQLVMLLNEYLTEMSGLIHELNGTVDKYEGDAIIAFWGAPLKTDNHAEMGVLSAVRQQRALAKLRADWREQGKDELFVRMGLNTGMMVVGNMGSKERMDYTMMGDSVNLAARLEGANKYYGSDILISEFTYKMVRDRFLCRTLDTVRVQGKKDSIRLYEVVEETSAITDMERRFVAAFRTAMAAFHRLDFSLATKLFERCEKLRPQGDVACQLYLKRCAELIEAPPPDDWDRVYDLAK